MQSPHQNTVRQCKQPREGQVPGMGLTCSSEGRSDSREDLPGTGDRRDETLSPSDHPQQRSQERNRSNVAPASAFAVALAPTSPAPLPAQTWSPPPPPRVSGTVSLHSHHTTPWWEQQLAVSGTDRVGASGAHQSRPGEVAGSSSAATGGEEFGMRVDV
jgi:hypothetical protein